MSTKYQKFLTTNDHHDENNFESQNSFARPIPDLVTPFLPTNNNHIIRPKPFPLYKQLHENLCKIQRFYIVNNSATDNNFSFCYIPAANINPFTPPGISLRKKRTRIEGDFLNSSLPIIQNNPIKPIHHKWLHTTTLKEQISTASAIVTNTTCDSFELCYDEELNEFRQAPKRLALQESNITRYEKEFVELKLLGVGEFGLVYQCLNRLDGCIYAIKRSIKPVAGSSFEKISLNEVYAHAVLGKHDNVVRYYSAWAENNHMLIQNEYCNGGSLQSLLQKRNLNEAELKILLLQVAEGLKYIHSHNLVHMDIKAGNIFLTKPPIR